MAASEVDLPEPVAPTTSTRPRLVMTISLSVSGRPSLAKSGISLAMVRITMPTFCCCMKTLTRKRATPGSEMAKLHSSSRRELLALALVHERVGQVARDLAGQLLVGQRLHGALQLHGRRKVLGDEQVRAARLAHRRQQLDDIGLGLLFGEARHRALEESMGCGDPSQTAVFRAVLLLTGRFFEMRQAEAFCRIETEGPPNPGDSVRGQDPLAFVVSGATVGGRRLCP